MGVFFNLAYIQVSKRYCCVVLCVFLSTRVHSFNRVDIPPYENYDKLYDKLLTAIEETCGFAVEWGTPTRTPSAIWSVQRCHGVTASVEIILHDKYSRKREWMQPRGYTLLLTMVLFWLIHLSSLSCFHRISELLDLIQKSSLGFNETRNEDFYLYCVK